MRLEDIIRNTGAEIVYGQPGTQVASICSDSRKVEPGALFVAVKGFATDGHKFIDAAISAGAAAVVSADRKGLALCAANFYDHPSEKLQLVGITGTNGKTTTVTLLYHLVMGLERLVPDSGHVGRSRLARHDIRAGFHPGIELFPRKGNVLVICLFTDHERHGNDTDPQLARLIGSKVGIAVGNHCDL